MRVCDARCRFPLGHMCCLVLSNEKPRCRLPPAAGSPCLLIFDLVSDLGYCVVVVVFVPLQVCLETFALLPL